MVQQMIDKFSEYRFINCGTDMATGDKQQPISAKKLALRDLPNETRNTIPKPPGNSPLHKDRGAISDSMKVSGTKRQQPSCPLSPARPEPPSISGTNRHLVYVRRKPETESGKIDGSDSPSVKKSSNDRTSEPKLQPDLAWEANASFRIFTTVPPASLNTSSRGSTPAYPLGRPITELPVPAPNYTTVSAGVPVQPELQRVPTEVPVQPEPQRPRDQHWKGRFLQLQMFLKSCDESSQEEYIRKLRSLSAAGRSRHAYELEKRAIQLLLEEGKELHRMKVLNVLGKASPDGHVSVSPQTCSSVEVVSEEQ